MVCPAGRGAAGVLAKCNCKFCAKIPNVEDEPATSTGLPKRWSRMPSKTSSGPGLQDITDECIRNKPRRKDIIIRNKKAIKCLSRKVRAQKALNRQKEIEGNRLFQCYKKENPKNKMPKSKKSKSSSLMDLVRARDDCACELMSNAIHEDLHKQLGLADTRIAINTGSPNFDTPPRVPSPKRKWFYFF